jgi:hypothetical protein
VPPHANIVHVLPPARWTGRAASIGSNSHLGRTKSRGAKVRGTTAIQSRSISVGKLLWKREEGNSSDATISDTLNQRFWSCGSF